jgi:hypothetical protein
LDDVVLSKQIKSVAESYRNLIEDKILMLIESEPQSWNFELVQNIPMAFHPDSTIVIHNPFSGYAIRVFAGRSQEEILLGWGSKRRISKSLRELHRSQFNSS